MCSHICKQSERRGQRVFLDLSVFGLSLHSKTAATYFHKTRGSICKCGKRCAFGALATEPDVRRASIPYCAPFLPICTNNYYYKGRRIFVRKRRKIYFKTRNVIRAVFRHIYYLPPCMSRRHRSYYRGKAKAYRVSKPITLA
jgi:hypothetical protein